MGVTAGASGLTERQLAAARLIAEGWSDKVIARRLGCSEQNVTHLIGRIARRWQLDHSRNVRVQIACRIAQGAI